MISALDVWALSGQGGAASLYRTLEAYGRRGHEVDFVCATVGANHHFGEPPSAPPELEGVRYHRIHLPSLQESRVRLPAIVNKFDQKLRFASLFPWLAAQRAESLLKERGADLLYGYEVHGVLAQGLVRRRHRLPLIARFQGTVMHPYLDRALDRLRRYEEVLALRAPADLYVMTDDGTMGDEVLARLNPGSAGKVRFWRNGLDLRHVRPPRPEEAAAARTALGLEADAFVLVSAARLAGWKRVDRAIDALALLKPRVAGACLLIVGDGEQRANLARQTAARGLGASVRFVGAVPQAEVLKFLWAADVFLSLNELSNVGNPLLEAMASGRCILTLDEGDTRDLVRDGDNGVLLPTGDPGAIAGALAGLAAEPGRRARLAAAASEFAGRNFWTWEERLQAELEAVEALVAPAPKPARVDV